MNKDVVILAIESSCDDTSAAVLRNGWLLAQTTASQAVHELYGGVVPELASRAHEKNIVPTVDAAIKKAGITLDQISAIGVTLGPGLMGSLLVGVSFAKGLATALSVPLIDVNHLQGHILAHFIDEEEKENKHPEFPFICLLVSGGNSQIVKVNSYKDMEILGQTIDDAAGETIDKCSKFMGLGYPGGPIIDRLARQGNSSAFTFNKPQIPGFDYSFSGLKTSLLYFLRDSINKNPNFIEENKEDLAASFEKTVVDVLMNKLEKAVNKTGIKRVAVAGGVSANTCLRNAFLSRHETKGWDVYIPPFSYTTDNAAMIGIASYFKYLDGKFCELSKPAFSRVII